MERDAFHVRRGRVGPLFLVPTTAFDERARLGGGRRVAHLDDDVIPGPRLGKIEHELRFAESRVVAVTVDEPWNREPSAKIDDARTRANPRLDLGVAANGGNAVAAHGDRLRAWMLRVHRKEVAVKEDEISATLLRTGRIRDEGRAKRGEVQAKRGHGTPCVEDW